MQHLVDRIEMVLTYLMAQIIPCTQKNDDGFLLNLSAGNSGASLLGLSTKYGAASGDIAPLGS